MKAHLEPFGGDRVEMSVEDICPFLDVTGTDEPLLIRINRTFIPVYTSNSIPYKFLAIPEDVEDELNVDIPSDKYIFIVKSQDEIKKILMQDGDYADF